MTVSNNRSQTGVLLLLTALLTFAFVVCTPPSLANDGATKYVTIPVFYLTDRKQVGASFGPDRRYPVNCQHHMYYGTAFVTVKNHLGMTPSAATKKLGWNFGNARPEKIVPKQMLSGTNGRRAKEDFFGLVHQALANNECPDLCVYVHGAADAFEDSLLDAADQEYFLQRPTILYSWPSHGKYVGYFIDSGNCEWSQEHFDMFLHDLKAFRQVQPTNVILIAHSMGTRMAIRSFPLLFNEDLVNDCELVSPDVDADTFRHYLRQARHDKRAIRVYVSNRDKMLPLVQLFSGGYYRLGEAANPTFNARRDNPLMQFERIDFTAIDTGFRGHQIPFPLISNLVRTGFPGSGWALIPEYSVHQPKLIRFVGHRAKFTIGETAPEATNCRRLVRVYATR